MLVTVFTPTYNRGHLLRRVYESLCKQTFKDFEWVIVDDGSTDGTEHLVNSEKIFTDVYFPVRYFKKENGGKHTAINYGVKEAKGELFFILDSDDVVPPNSLKTITEEWGKICEDHSFGGICGLDGTFEGKVIGSGLSKDIIDGNSIDVRFKMGVTGDMKEVFRTEVLKEFPFPEIADERFCPEVLVWNRIATKYKLRYMNQIVYLAEYQEGGISANIVKARMSSPIASTITYAEMVSYDIPFRLKVKSAINFYRFGCCMKRSSPNRGLSVGKSEIAWYWRWAKPLGWMMHLRDLRV